MLRNDIKNIVNELATAAGLDFEIMTTYNIIFNYCKENKTRPRAEVTTAQPRPQNKPPYYIAVIPEAMNHATTGDSTPASLKRANIPPRPNKRHTTPYNKRQQQNKGILYPYNAIQGHYSPAGHYLPRLKGS